jgi:hypothetical protein
MRFKAAIRSSVANFNPIPMVAVEGAVGVPEQANRNVR